MQSNLKAIGLCGVSHCKPSSFERPLPCSLSRVCVNEGFIHCLFLSKCHRMRTSLRQGKILLDQDHPIGLFILVVKKFHDFFPPLSIIYSVVNIGNSQW